jgi:hypothetical protein
MPPFQGAGAGQGIEVRLRLLGALRLLTLPSSGRLSPRHAPYTSLRNTRLPLAHARSLRRRAPAVRAGGRRTLAPRRYAIHAA